MHACVAQDSTKSVPTIYNDCRNEAADMFPGSTREAFLQTFPTYSAVQGGLYKERRTKVPPNPQKPSDIDIESDRFLYTDGRREESIIKGDAMLDDGSRILVLSTNQHLDLLARSSEILCDGSFRVCPSLWTQLFIISCKVDETTYVPCGLLSMHSFLQSQRLAT